MRLGCAKHSVVAGHKIENEAAVCKTLGRGWSRDSK